MLLQQPYLVTDRRRCQAEFVCCVLEAEVPSRGLKSPQGAEWWEPFHRPILDEINSPLT
jgi:hypothetical protein